MKMSALVLSFLAALLLAAPASAQTFARSPAPGSSSSTAADAQLQALIKKVDEQSAKIDVLSQQILKLEQQLASQRPGVIIGEPTPSAPAAQVEASSHSAAATAAASGNTHIVARGETLTSIAKMYGVTVGELQKWNHIDDGRKLQMGQTIVISGGASPAPSASSGE